MSNFEETQLSVCTVCLHLMANGEFNDGTDAAEVAAAGMAKIWGDDARHLIAGTVDLGFCTTSCDTCGDDLHGDRHVAVALIPQA